MDVPVTMHYKFQQSSPLIDLHRHRSPMQRPVSCVAPLAAHSEQLCAAAVQPMQRQLLELARVRSVHALEHGGRHGTCVPPADSDRGVTDCILIVLSETRAPHVLMHFATRGPPPSPSNVCSKLLSSPWVLEHQVRLPLCSRSQARP